jgi:hypothetical protein
MSVKLLRWGNSPGDVVSLENLTCDSDVVDPADATCVYRLENDGDVMSTNGNNSVVDRGDWIAPRVNMALFSARVTMISGTLSSGTTGSFLNLGTTREWQRNRTTIGSNACSFTVDIQRDSNSVIVASATIDMTASVN